MYNIRNTKIKSNKDYLETGERSRLNTNIRIDLKNELEDLSKKIRIPKSKILDVVLFLIFHDEETQKKFIKLLKEY